MSDSGLTAATRSEAEALVDAIEKAEQRVRSYRANAVHQRTLGLSGRGSDEMAIAWERHLDLLRAQLNDLKSPQPEKDPCLSA